jgi:uncharacterized protein YbaP (TraB family)
MKNLFILAMSLLSGSTFAQTENSLLYRISGNGIEAPSYIFGTIHITCDATLDDLTRKALEETTQMYLELDMDDAEMQTNMMKHLAMKEGKKLSDLLSEDDYKILNSYLKEKMNIPAEAVATYKPFVLSATFLSSLLDCAPQSFETELMKVSVAQKEPIFGLETVEEQMAIFDQIPYQMQADELIKSIKNNFKEDKIELNLLIKTHATKNLIEMQRHLANSKNAMMTEYEGLLLTDRNRNWIKSIVEITKEAPTFFGVGAAHLLGPEGVIHLLRERGYSVEAL